MILQSNNPMRSAVLATLIFEIIVIWLGFIGMLQVSQVNLAVALPACLGVTLLCAAACAGLRKPWGYLVGWLAQLALLALGLLNVWMIAMGVVFGLIWVAEIVLGKRIEAHKEKQ